MLVLIAGVALVISLDALLIGLLIGAQKIDLFRCAGFAVFTVLFHVLFAYAGFVVGATIPNQVGQFSRGLGIGILVILVIYLLLALKEKRVLPNKSFLIISVLLSQDAAYAGVGIGSLQASPRDLLATVGIITGILVICGLFAGRLFRGVSKKKRVTLPGRNTCNQCAG